MAYQNWQISPCSVFVSFLILVLVNLGGPREPRVGSEESRDLAYIISYLAYISM